jgi:predicted alpha/beta superfamily hydrolase
MNSPLLAPVLPPVDSFLLPSVCVRQTFRIDVVRPAQTETARERLPVVFVSDGNIFFDALRGIVRALQLSATFPHRYLLVGIGYPHDSVAAGIALRARDFTFSGFPNYLGRPLRGADALEPVPGSRAFLGADDFQRFLSCELIPSIDERYATLPGDRIYFGHSSGASFGLYSLFTAPHLFRKYLLVSPAVCFHGIDADGQQHENDDFGIRAVRRLIAAGAAFEDTGLYLCAGGDEEFDAAAGRWQFTSGFYRLAALLKSSAIPGLHLTTRVFAGDTHMTVWPSAFIHGVQALLGTSLSATSHV